MKPIIATTLSGLFIKTTPWKEAHKKWFEQIIKETGDDSFRQWINREDYFEGVNLAMTRIMPDASKEERTKEARKRFMQAVVGCIKENKGPVNKDVADFFISLKEKYSLALITTNTKDFINKILDMTKLSNLFDIIEASESSEEDDKAAVFERFIKKYGKPLIYIGGDRKDSYDFCKQRNILCAFANLEGAEDMGVKTAHNLEDIRKLVLAL